MGPLGDQELSCLPATQPGGHGHVRQAGPALRACGRASAAPGCFSGSFCLTSQDWRPFWEERTDSRAGGRPGRGSGAAAHVRGQRGRWGEAGWGQRGPRALPPGGRRGAAACGARGPGLMAGRRVSLYQGKGLGQSRAVVSAWCGGGERGWVAPRYIQSQVSGQDRGRPAAQLRGQTPGPFTMRLQVPEPQEPLLPKGALHTHPPKV